MEANLRARTLSETGGFIKALVGMDHDRILGFTAFGIGAGEIMTSVQIAMIAGQPYTALRGAVLTHPNPGRRSHTSVLMRQVSAQRRRDKRSSDIRCLS